MWPCRPYSRFLQVMSSRQTLPRSHEVHVDSDSWKSTVMVHESWYIWVLDDVRLWDIEVIFNVTFETRLAQKLLCNVFFFITVTWNLPCENHLMRTRLIIELPFPEMFSDYVVCSRLNTTNRALWPTLPDMVSLRLWLHNCSAMC